MRALSQERASISRSAAMKMVGHKTDAIYERYAIADTMALEEAAIKLAALHDRDAAKASNVVPLKTGTEK